MVDDNKESSKKLLQLLQDVVQEETALREKYQIGDKFRFIREKLAALKQKIEENMQEMESKEAPAQAGLAEDEMLVYVYLFNTQGLSAATWQKLLQPSVLYEYSVNRPIYKELAHIESFIRSRTSKVQHGYLTIAIKKEHLLPAGLDAQNDAIGNPLCKVKEGAFQFDRVISFRHNEHDYTLKQNGEMVKKAE